MSNTRITTSKTRRMVIRSYSSGQGSTSLCKRLVENKFNKYGEVTIGADFSIKHLGDTKLNIWDTCAQDRFDSVLLNYYYGADIFLFCLSAPDLLDKNCDLNKINMKLNQINKVANCPLILVITKCDLLSTQEKIDLKEKLEYCVTGQKLHGFSSHVFCSAFDGSGFDLLKDEITKLLPVNHKEEELQIIPERKANLSITMKVKRLFTCCNREPTQLTELKHQHERSTLKIG